MKTDRYWQIQWEVGMAEMTRDPDAAIHGELLAEQAREFPEPNDGDFRESR